MTRCHDLVDEPLLLDMRNLFCHPPYDVRTAPRVQARRNRTPPFNVHPLHSFIVCPMQSPMSSTCDYPAYTKDRERAGQS